MQPWESQHIETLSKQKKDNADIKLNCLVKNENEISHWLEINRTEITGQPYGGKEKLVFQNHFLQGDKFQMIHNYYKQYEAIKCIIENI